MKKWIQTPTDWVMAKLSQHPLAKEAAVEHPHQLGLLHQSHPPQERFPLPTSPRSSSSGYYQPIISIIIPTSISSTFNSTGNTNFTCLFSHWVFSNPKRPALFVPIFQKRKRRLIEVKWLPKVTQPVTSTVGIQTQEGPASESPVQWPQHFTADSASLFSSSWPSSSTLFQPLFYFTSF